MGGTGQRAASVLESTCIPYLSGSSSPWYRASGRPRRRGWRGALRAALCGKACKILTLRRVFVVCLSATSMRRRAGGTTRRRHSTGLQIPVCVVCMCARASGGECELQQQRWTCWEPHPWCGGWWWSTGGGGVLRRCCRACWAC